MKKHILPMLAAGLSLLLVGVWSMAAPAPAPIAGKPKEIVSVKAQRFNIKSLAFSPDGKILASGAREGNLKLWDTGSGKNLVDIQACREDKRGASGIVCGLAFSPDGKTIATSGDDRKVQLWDVATKKNTDTINASTAPPLLFSPDGKNLICGCNILDLKTHKSRSLVKDIKGMWPVVTFDPKGRLLLAATTLMYPDAPSCALWDVETRKRIHTCKGDRKVVQCGAFSPDGKMIVSTEEDFADMRRWLIRFWDVASGERKATFEYPEIPCIPTFTPDSKILAVSCRRNGAPRDYPGTIHLYEVSSGKVLATLKGHKQVVGCLAFSRDGRLLASGSNDGVIKIWRLPRRYKAE